MELSFDRFKLDPGYVLCLSDSLQVYDGDYKSGDSLGIYCDDAVPESLKSSGRYLWVRFISERGYNSNYPGFKARFNAVDKQVKSELKVFKSGHNTILFLEIMEMDLNLIDIWSQHIPELCTWLVLKALSFLNSCSHLHSIL